MITFTVRSARADDKQRACGLDVLVDQWHSGGNRRSLVAVTPTGQVLGHCRGIDNSVHPLSRTCVLEVNTGLEPSDELALRRALLAAQAQVSTRPLHLKLTADDTVGLAAARQCGAVIEQLMPPWRHVVDTAGQAWGRRHAAATEPIGATDREAILAAAVDYYCAQHAAWSPADSVSLRDQWEPDFAADQPGSYDPSRSCLMRRAGQIVAAALVWPAEEADDSGQEVTFLALPYEGTTADGDLCACLAHVYATSPLGSILLIDSHVTERNESTVVAGLPGKSPDPRDKWTAIVAVPAATGPAVRPLDPSLIPAAAAWAW